MAIPPGMTWQQFLADRVSALDRMVEAMNALGQFVDVPNIADFQRQVVKIVLPQIIADMQDIFNNMG